MKILFRFLLPLLASGIAIPARIPGNGLRVDGLPDLEWPASRSLPVKITKTPSGGLVGWVKREEQGDIASPPPLIEMHPPEGQVFPEPELLGPGVERGPAGTVPFQILTKANAANVPPKYPPPSNRKRELQPRASAVPHYYGATEQIVDNYGGKCFFSLYKPNVTGLNDESLVQIAETRTINTYVQSAEAGWQVLPSLNNNDRNPHLFTYFTTVNHSSEGDNVGGYNTRQKGFVQTSSTYYPGMTFTPYSTINGTQYSLGLYYTYYQGDWWLSVNNMYLGYYPGATYAKNNSIVNTLGEKATEVQFYGEITDSTYPTAPRTDMGSGRFANAGFGNVAYMGNLSYQATNGGSYSTYFGVANVPTPQWYTLESHMNSNTSFGSYFYVGGPGAG